MSRTLIHKPTKSYTYTAFKKIDGNHPLKQAVENIYVGYQAYIRQGGEVAYFNFELAKEMGLIPFSHPHQLNNALKKQILDTFSLQIINEYDIAHKTKIDVDLIKPNEYMATRYLQIQHPNKQGKTSGDGRSIWNGCLKTRHGLWDISSCGTGATRLSPATANENCFFKTGTRLASYGCGRADFSEGMIAALFSQMMYQKGISTERTLAVIRYKNGNAINVRAAKNLLRPAHFFGYMKRGELAPLKQLLDYHIEREISNGNIQTVKNKQKQYHIFLNKFAEDFAIAAARFESEYIFCWMDWDGDNILMDGGIIDYGTIRQFGLFHHEYRYDDVDKMSTNITEQKNKARYTVQRFAQVVDFLISGEKKNIKQFTKHPVLNQFDQAFHEALVQQLLYRIGFTQSQQQMLFSNKATRDLAYEFQKQYRYFEKAVSGRRAYKTPDGVTRDAIFCMRDFLREIPLFNLKYQTIMTPLEFIATIASNYSSQRDLLKYEKKVKRIENLQKTYMTLLKYVEESTGLEHEQLLKQIIQRSGMINRYDILTGNGVIRMVDRLLKERPKLTLNEFQTIIYFVTQQQITDPDLTESPYAGKYGKSKKLNELALRLGKLVGKYRESI